jgi:hypothetical protein
MRLMNVSWCRNLQGQDSTRGPLKISPHARRPVLNAFACTIIVFERISRFLLIAIGVSLITMPVTQHFWIWDHFLHGGSDFELTTLLLLSFLGMALVLSRQLKDCVNLLFVSWRYLSFNDSLQGRIRLVGVSSLFQAEFPAARPIDVHSLPLRI